MKKVLAFLSLIASLFALTGCFTIARVGDINNPIDVEYALEEVNQYVGDEVYIMGYPIAFQTSYSVNDTKTVSIYFSDSYDNATGELNSFEELPENCLILLLNEEDPLAKYIIDNAESLQDGLNITVICKGQNDKTFGYYYEYVEWYQ